MSLLTVIVTLVEKHSRFLKLARVYASKMLPVIAVLFKDVKKLRKELYESLT